MKIALRTDCFGNDVSRVCDYAEGLGVKDIHAFPPIAECYDDNGLMTARLLEKYASAFRDRGLVLRMLSEVLHDEALDTEEGMVSRTRALAATLSAMGKVGIESLFIFIAASRPDDEDSRERRWEHLIRLYKEIVPLAEQADVQLSSHGHASRARLVFASSDMWRVLNSVPSSVNGVTLCMGCYALAGEDPARLVHEFGDRIVSVHARDAIRNPEPKDVRLGTGIVDVKAVLRELQSIGFDGLVCPEHMPPIRHDRDEEAAVAWAVGYLTACLQ